jgi:ethanolamine utilization protein EutN
MYLGKVIGTCVCTRIYPDLDGLRLLVVQPLDHHRKPRGNVEVAVDTVQCGPGEIVYLVGSREASQALEKIFVPVDSAIIGHVDSVDLEGEP